VGVRVLVSAVICGEVGEWGEDGRESGRRWDEGRGMQKKGAEERNRAQR
jgi:hypothetical protein